MKPITDEQVDSAIGIILRTGVTISALLVAAGGIGYLMGRGTTPAPEDLTSFGAIWRGALTGEPLFIVQFGLVVLMATPLVRVIACVIGFALEHDWAYTVISAIVLACLVFSLL